MTLFNFFTLSAHPKTKAFIMHCGMNSLQEAAHYGVPLIAVPFFGDQTYNAAIVHHKQLGFVLQKDKLTEEAVTDALRKLLGDEKYVETDHEEDICRMFHKT